MATVPSRIGNWILGRNLGSGFSGSIWLAENPYTGQTSAIKIQHVDSDCPTNRYERNFYPILQGGKGMPTLWAAGVQGPYDYLVIDLLGPSLDNLYRQNQKQVFDLRSVICIAIQVVRNCVVGLPPNEKTIYMIDFGFSKRYVDPVTKRHIPDSKVKRDFIGNYWFTSVNVHCRGKVPSRRDDLEALALMLIHLLTPNGLPWTRHGVPKTAINEDRLIRAKRNAKPEELCYGLPEEFEDFLRYCRRLRFAEQPNYQIWRDAFIDLATSRGWTDVADEKFHWPPRVEKITPPEMTVVRQHVPSPRKTIPPRETTDVAKLLGDIANLNLNNHQVPGAKKPEKPTFSEQPKELGKENVTDPVHAEEVIVISSGDENCASETNGSQRPVKSKTLQPATRWNKAAALVRLTAEVSTAADNKAMAQIVRQFTDVLQMNRSKTLTKEGFAFLTALTKQLEDPSVFAVHSKAPRPSRTRSGTRAQLKQAVDPGLIGEDKGGDPERTKRVRDDKLWALRRKIADAPAGMSNTQLARMVSDFEAVVKASRGRCVTMDGLAFLAGVEARLKVI